MPEAPSKFSLSLAKVEDNILIQGLNEHRKSGTKIGHRAENVAGQAEQDVVFFCFLTGGDVKQVRVRKGGHGSSTGLEDYDDNTVRVWFGHDGLKTSGYVQFDIGDSGTVAFTPTDLPEGDIEIDNDNNRLILRNGNRYRLYDFSTVKANKRVKLADFTIPAWGERWQGMFLVEGHLLVHRDVKTKGASQAAMFDLTGALPKTGGQLKPVETWDTTGMGDEAEGFHSELSADRKSEVVYVMKRTGPAGARRVFEGHRLVVLPKLVGSTPVPNTLHGVDVSSWQPDWAPAQNDAFCFVKATEGTTYTNPERAAQLAKARDKGLVVGHYHWLVPGKAKEQAAYFVAKADIRPGDLLWCDWEKQGDGGHPSVADAATFIAEVKRLVPSCKVGLYCNKSDWLGTKVKAGDALWLAAYLPAHGVTSPLLKFWQYSRTPIDQNVGYFQTVDELKAWATVTPPAPPVVVEPKPEQPKPEQPTAGDVEPVVNVGIWVVDPAKVSTVLLGRDTKGKIADELSPGTTIADGLKFIKNSVGRYALLTAKGFSYDREYLTQISAAPVVRPFPTIPDYDVLERIRFRGGLTCRCVAISLPWVEHAMLQAGAIKYNLDLYQLGYRTDVTASADTHARGGNTDGAQFSDLQLAIWRAMGWTAQRRTTAQGFTAAHWHGWPNGCPHLSPGAQAQQRSWNLGRDGLRQNLLITGPAPKGKATPRWDVALADYMKRVSAPAPSTTTT